MTALPTLPPPGQTSAPFRVVLYEGVGSTALGDGDRARLLSTLLTQGHAVSSVRTGAPTPRTAITAGTLLVLGQFDAEQPEAALDHAGGVAVWFRGIAGLEAAQVAELVTQARAEANQPKPAAWKPWFPVIDYDRCTNCMQCLSFCLFDVYGVSADKKIQVQNHNKCKTDCPACSRVCPEVAILFPKYRHGPINGDVVSTDDVRREVMKVDISALLGGDIYQALRDRSAKSKSRFAKERDEDRALQERQKCLVKLGEKLDIPAEVFASLPSVDEIRNKASEAAAKADAARAEAGVS